MRVSGLQQRSFTIITGVAYCSEQLRGNMIVGYFYFVNNSTSLLACINEEENEEFPV